MKGGGWVGVGWGLAESERSREILLTTQTQLRARPSEHDGKAPDSDVEGYSLACGYPE